MTPYPMIIDGKPVIPTEHFEVINPATGTVAALAPVGDKTHVDAAMQAAHIAFRTWKTLADTERQALCKKLAEVLEDNAEELAKLLTLEQGKPLNGTGSRFELGACALWARSTADLSLPVEILQDDADKRIELHRKPIGVVASITPWNWPLQIAIWHILPALRAGNTVVIKPSSLTPIATLRMVELFNQVLPAGVLNIITGGNSIGALMTRHPRVGKITFTGSTPTGRKIMASGADTLKRMTLELGGNDAGIVLPDVDPKQIAEGIFWGAFINNGQTCAALKRLYVHDDIYEAVCDALVDFAKTVSVGDGMLESSVLGPVQNKMQYDLIADLVEDAVADGARVILGGNPGNGPGYFYPITLVADVSHGTRLVKEEQFGPVLPIIRYSDIEEVLRHANDSDMGLGGSVWGRDHSVAKALALRLECGSVWINAHGALSPKAPFGGIKQSGLGVEFGLDGLKEFTTIQSVHC